MVDSHCHLDFQQFDKDRFFVIKRCQETLNFCINPTVNAESVKKSLEVLKDYEFIYILLGFHPHYAKDFKNEILEFYKDLLKKEKKIVGIGEVGLDFYKNLSPKNIQINVFEKFLELAMQYKLPLVIHLREAESEAERILNNYKFNSPVIMHCFSHSYRFFEYCLERGFYLSFAGNITYPQNNLLREILKKTPLDRLLLETDSPYLTPQEKRGLRNEPSFIIYTLRFVSELINLEEKKLEKIIEENSKKAFMINR